MRKTFKLLSDMMILGCSMELLTEIILVAENNRYRWSNKHKIWFQWIGHITKVLWDNRCSWIGRNKSLIAQKIAKLKKVFFLKKKRHQQELSCTFRNRALLLLRSNTSQIPSKARTLAIWISFQGFVFIQRITWRYLK